MEVCCKKIYLELEPQCPAPKYRNDKDIIIKNDKAIFYSIVCVFVFFLCKTL